MCGRPAAFALGQQRIRDRPQALAADPGSLPLDEPPRPASEKEARSGELLRRLRAEGMVIPIVEHDMDFAREPGRSGGDGVRQKIAEGLPTRSSRTRGARGLSGRVWNERENAMNKQNARPAPALERGPEEPGAFEVKDLCVVLWQGRGAHRCQPHRRRGPDRHRDRPQRRRQDDDAVSDHGRSRLAGEVAFDGSVEGAPGRAHGLARHDPGAEKRELFGEMSVEGQPGAGRLPALIAWRQSPPQTMEEVFGSSPPMSAAVRPVPCRVASGRCL